MTLQQRLEAFATAVKNKINSMVPRLLPQGGTAGQALVKGTADDYVVSWVSVASSSRGVYFSYAGKPSASERIVASRNYAFTVSQANSSAVALVAATSTTVFTIRKGSSSSSTVVGTVTFNASATVGTVSITSGSILATDSVWIESPATPDATLADIGVTIKE